MAEENITQSDEQSQPVAEQAQQQAQQGQQVTYQQPQQPVQPQVIDSRQEFEQCKQPKRTSGLGTASMVLGIVGAVLAFIPFVNVLALICGILALIFGIITLAKRRGKGQPIAGVVLGSLTIFISIAVFIFSLIFIGSCFKHNDRCDENWRDYYYEDYYGYDIYNEGEDDYDFEGEYGEQQAPGQSGQQAPGQQGQQSQKGQKQQESSASSETTNELESLVY